MIFQLIELIIRLTDQLKKDKKIEPPSWTAYVKTGPHVTKFPRTETGGIQEALLY